jgi:antitoxin FitA
MASMTIRNIDEQLKARLRIAAAQHGRSMEDEARDILRIALSTQQPGSQQSIAESIRRRIQPLGGVELNLPAREPAREPVDFA